MFSATAREEVFTDSGWRGWRYNVISLCRTALNPQHKKKQNPLKMGKIEQISDNRFAETVQRVNITLSSHPEGPCRMYLSLIIFMSAFGQINEEAA